MSLKLNPYGDLEELDLSMEVMDFITGVDFGNEKYIPHVFREKRTLDNGKPDRCRCWNEQSNEGRVGCGDCEGEGVLWDESIIPGFTYYLTQKSLAKTLAYKSEMGRAEHFYIGLLVPLKIDIKQHDKIYLPKMTECGTLVSPYQADEEYFVNQTRKFRLDNGSSEFTSAIITRVQ